MSPGTSEDFVQPEPAGYDDVADLILNVAAHDQRRLNRTVTLRRAGYTVVEADSEWQAMHTVVHRDVSLAVIDGDLPACDLVALSETLQLMRPALAVVVVPPKGATSPAAPAGEIRDGDDLLLTVATALGKDDGEDNGPDPHVVTDVFGRIQGTSDHGARLLNGSPRGLSQRNLVTFFDARRDVWHEAIRRARAGEQVHIKGRIRPRGRKPLDVSVRIISRADTGGALLEWAIEPA